MMTSPGPALGTGRVTKSYPSFSVSLTRHFIWEGTDILRRRVGGPFTLRKSVQRIAAARGGDIMTFLGSGQWILAARWGAPTCILRIDGMDISVENGNADYASRISAMGISIKKWRIESNFCNRWNYSSRINAKNTSWQFYLGNMSDARVSITDVYRATTFVAIHKVVTILFLKLTHRIARKVIAYLGSCLTCWERRWETIRRYVRQS